MKKNKDSVQPDFKSAYDNFYQTHNQEWRLLGARYKAQNIMEVCRGHQFKKVLEVGAGDGSILQYLDEANFALELYALEIASSGVQLIQSKKLNTIKSVQEFDGYHIPFADNEFDLVILSHVLEHVEFERTLLRELKRVSHYQVIEVPRDYRYNVDKRLKHFLNYGHINVYTPSSLRFLLRSEGFEILADKLSMITPEVTKFNSFTNQKKSSSAVLSLKIDAEYGIKKTISKIMGRKQAEKFANAYTVLTQKTANPDIF